MVFPPDRTFIFVSYSRWFEVHNFKLFWREAAVELSWLWYRNYLNPYFLLSKNWQGYMPNLPHWWYELLIVLFDRYSSCHLNRSEVSYSLCIVCLLVPQACPRLCYPMDCSPPSSSAHGIPQSRILEWVAMPSFRGSSQPRDWTQDSCLAGKLFTVWATREAHV